MSYSRIPLSFTVLASGLTYDSTIPGSALEGISKVIKVKFPDVANVVTLTINIYDPDGDLLYTKAAIAKNTITIIDDKCVPCWSGGKVNLTFSGNTGTAMIATVIIYIP